MAERRFQVGDTYHLIVIDQVPRGAAANLFDLPQVWLVQDPPIGEFNPYDSRAQGEYRYCLAMGDEAQYELVDLAEAVGKALAHLREVERG